MFIFVYTSIILVSTPLGVTGVLASMPKACSPVCLYGLRPIFTYSTPLALGFHLFLPFREDGKRVAVFTGIIIFHNGGIKLAYNGFVSKLLSCQNHYMQVLCFHAATRFPSSLKGRKR